MPIKYGIYVQSAHLSGYLTETGIDSRQRNATPFLSIGSAEDKIKELGYENTAAIKPQVNTAFVCYLDMDVLLGA